MLEAIQPRVARSSIQARGVQLLHEPMKDILHSAYKSVYSLFAVGVQLKGSYTKFVSKMTPVLFPYYQDMSIHISRTAVTFNIVFHSLARLSLRPSSLYLAV